MGKVGKGQSSMGIRGLLVVAPERVVDDADPWGDDLLGRKKYGDALQKAVDALADDGASILLDGGYGTGKTFVLERWMRELRKQGVPVRYYNAWQCDGDDDPLWSLMECICDAEAPDVNIASAGAEAAGQAIKLIAGVDLAKIIRAGCGKGPLQAAADERRKARDKLQEGLRQWGQAAGDRRTVVIVDELDRCRPAFALRLMERVKHMLKTPGVAFVFGASRRALEGAVTHEQGAGVDAEGYMRRMFTWHVALPSGVVQSYRSGGEYMDKLAARHGLAEAISDISAYGEFPWRGQIRTILALLADGGKVTPREFEKIIQLVAGVVRHSVGDDGVKSLQGYILTPMAVAKVMDPVAYDAMVTAPDGGAGVVSCVSRLIGDRTGVPDGARHSLAMRMLDAVEIVLYYACSHRSDSMDQPRQIKILEAMAGGKEVPKHDLELLADRSRQASAERAKALLKNPREWVTAYPDSSHFHYILKYPETVRGLDERFNMMQ